eukprot:3999197-Alexandrium_andersonii.AAC.1
MNLHPCSAHWYPYVIQVSITACSIAKHRPAFCHAPVFRASTRDDLLVPVSARAADSLLQGVAGG